MSEVKSFLGTGWSFPPRFDSSDSSIQMVSDEEDIRESLFLLLSTTPGERITNPEYGCDLRQFIFKPIDSTTIFLMKEVISHAVLMHEPRIVLDEIQVDVPDPREGLVFVKLLYTITKVNVRTNMVYPFYINQGTDIVEV